MFTSKLRSGVLVVAALVLVGLPSVAGAQAVKGDSSPEAAVRQLLDAAVNPSATGNCNVITGQLDGCSVTARFAQRVAGAAENGNIVIRSQNPTQTINYTLLDNDSKTAHVDAQFVFGAFMYTITFVAVNQSGSWLVDDSYCKDAPETSIYNAPTGPCNVIAAGGTAGGGTNAPGTPPVGMPNTGNAAPGGPAMLMWGSLGAVILLAGLVVVAADLRRRKA